MAKEINSKEFKELVLENKNQLVVVDFYANWCGPCRMLAPIITEVCEENNVTLYKVNTDENEDLAKQNGVLALPTVMFFRNGEMVEKFVGFRPQESIDEIIKMYK